MFRKAIRPYGSSIYFHNEFKMMGAIYKSTMEEDIGCGLQMKSQQELFGKKEKFILKQSKEKKKVHFKFKSTNISPSQKSNDVSDGGEELYFDAMDQNVNMDEMPATAVTQIQSTSSSHIGNSREKFEEISTLNVLAKRLPSRPLASTKS
ncbi:hypothetical protein RhiirA1_522923 [Rhizophagus irregularis]|uniref:Uncharacterized protein n=3 Tax=Rhizophagus irregularis TaxID=588596 RepID=A0A2N0RFH1_9GLOM|nr:hypothetical protein GLOIN_2v1763033 [Rhizophagus irregularis DAOM 181602=DAOM 197198]PKC62064.1 hypothetical protein RhiirA1_522923 [Rhizophagus irregularis]PKK62261.1 hypothetical protein RhiirC2_717835 [Rhizophagus irregularis]POG81792.1 hypothetical protein GLOIN_2v1763033 [Rhizophagus irregularis DAOM 181602=DAOM 197198]UZO01292.1 hypothetical protein OCT59_012393 [Rhizophagus irregularis]GBC40326.1 hypothetical protein GLOIN_2v1763033 [Rhizophagus irregularis DAOM 181602=DAOM 197198]|eukprot:XP_025188658.1 hypothetical protein GLOIN_2v1763033 [Rhizophagus irregularis DAOM 181602=DAOM 197198]